ncbi:MAG: glutamate-cysteine ligase family protein [Acidobacteriota bacterium]
MSTDLPGDDTVLTSPRQMEDLFAPRGPVRGRVGVEWEQVPVDSRGRPVPFDGPAGVEALLLQLASTHKAILEGGRCTALRLSGGGMLGLEPGGQVEIASPPSARMTTLHRFLARTCREVDGAARQMGFRLAPWGLSPYAEAEDVPDVPKARYALLKDHLERAGTRGRRMMKLTASTQICLDYLDEEDMGRMVSAVTPLLPYVVAYTANSPVYRGRRSRWVSQRPWIWRGTDVLRTGLPGFLFDAPVTYRQWVRYGLSRPGLFLIRDGRYLPGDGRTFGDWMKHGAPGGALRVSDWLVHWSTLFPEVRIRGYLEIRTVDSLPLPLVLAVAALFKGLLCPPEAPGFWGVRLPRWTPRECRAALLEAARLGPRWAPLEGPSPHAVLSRLVRAASAGLASLGEEDSWLAPFKELVDRDACPADHWRKDAAGRWRGAEDPDPIY